MAGEQYLHPAPDYRLVVAGQQERTGLPIVKAKAAR